MHTHLFTCLGRKPRFIKLEECIIEPTNPDDFYESLFKCRKTVPIHDGDLWISLTEGCYKQTNACLISAMETPERGLKYFQKTH